MHKEEICNFCGSTIPIGKGFLYVRRDGSILKFCSRKCKVSMLEMGRNPRKLKWTKKYERKIR